MTIFLVGTIEPSLKIADFGKLFLAKSLIKKKIRCKCNKNVMLACYFERCVKLNLLRSGGRKLRIYTKNLKIAGLPHTEHSLMSEDYIRVVKF